MTKYIFTDFFDTLMLRRIHSYQIYRQWALGVLSRYPELKVVFAADSLEDVLHKSRRALRKDYKEPPYRLVIGGVYDELCAKVSLPISKDSFVGFSLDLDIAIELGCQYPNKSIVNKFRKYKREGCKVYIVSDFYLPGQAYKDFLIKAGIQDIIDGVYVSEEHNCTKVDGSLYDYVLKDLDLNPQDVTMFGDSKHSDVKMSKSRGIKAVWYFPFCHKVWTNISRKLNLDYSRRIDSAESKWLYKNSCFEEYSLILYHFNQVLANRAKNLGADKLAFLSRGGYFLNEVFNTLKNAMGGAISGEYCLNSRKVCFAARDQKSANGEQYILMKEYMDQFKSGNGSIYIVDEGWYNHSQQAMCATFGYDMYGLYIGSRAKEPLNCDCVCHREGLLFDYRTSKDKSKYYGVLCTNCSMYEQILTAEHGSVVGYYRRDDGTVDARLKENEKEIEIYNLYIRQMQERMMLQIKGLAAWKLGSKLSEKKLAKMILKTSVFANHRRCQFLNDLDSHRYDNCSAGKRAPDKGLKDVRINIVELLMNPDDYLGMFCKLQRKLDKNVITRYLYYPFGACYYAYTYLLTFVLR